MAHKTETIVNRVAGAGVETGIAVVINAGLYKTAKFIGDLTGGSVGNAFHAIALKLKPPEFTVSGLIEDTVLNAVLPGGRPHGRHALKSYIEVGARNAGAAAALDTVASQFLEQAPPAIRTEMTPPAPAADGVVAFSLKKDPRMEVALAVAVPPVGLVTGGEHVAESAAPAAVPDNSQSVARPLTARQ